MRRVNIVLDNKGRKIEYLRISITDRCNLRCTYCMPEKGVEQVYHDNIMSLDELYAIVKETSELGIEKVRITGGEPLVRKGIISFIKKIKSIDKIKEVSITTNGILLEENIDELYDAGLDRINISLDTFMEKRYEEITRRKGLKKVLNSIDKAIKKGFKRIKINTVITRELNFDEISSFVDLARQKSIDVRFIELMPIGEGKKYTSVSNDEIKKIIEKDFKLKPIDKKNGSGPAKYYEIHGGLGTIGFISAMSHEFCNECNRIRITPEGFLKLCLHSNKGINLRELIRQGITNEELRNILKDNIFNKPDRHHFKENTDDADVRLMSQIGG